MPVEINKRLGCLVGVEARYVMGSVSVERPVELATFTEEVAKLPPPRTSDAVRAPAPVLRCAAARRSYACGVVHEIPCVPRVVQLLSVAEQVHHFGTRVANQVAARPAPILREHNWLAVKEIYWGK